MPPFTVFAASDADAAEKSKGLLLKSACTVGSGVGGAGGVRGGRSEAAEADKAYDDEPVNVDEVWKHWNIESGTLTLKRWRQGFEPMIRSIGLSVNRLLSTIIS